MRKDQQDYRRVPWNVGSGRELPPIPTVSLFNSQPFPFTATGKEYEFISTTYAKLHVPLKQVRSIPDEWPTLWS